MAAMASNWLKNWKSLKIFFRTTGWIETKFSHNAGTAHPLEQMRASSNQIHCVYPVRDIQITIRYVL
jgi:hypothetical protein